MSSVTVGLDPMPLQEGVNGISSEHTARTSPKVTAQDLQDEAQTPDDKKAKRRQSSQGAGNRLSGFFSRLTSNSGTGHGDDSLPSPNHSSNRQSLDLAPEQASKDGQAGLPTLAHRKSGSEVFDPPRKSLSTSRNPSQQFPRSSSVPQVSNGDGTNATPAKKTKRVAISGQDATGEFGEFLQEAEDAERKRKEVYSSGHGHSMSLPKFLTGRKSSDMNKANSSQTQGAREMFSKAAAGIAASAAAVQEEMRSTLEAKKAFPGGLPSKADRLPRSTSVSAKRSSQDGLRRIPLSFPAPCGDISDSEEASSSLGTSVGSLPAASPPQLATQTSQRSVLLPDGKIDARSRGEDDFLNNSTDGELNGGEKTPRGTRTPMRVSTDDEEDEEDGGIVDADDLALHRTISDAMQARGLSAVPEDASIHSIDSGNEAPPPEKAGKDKKGRKRAPSDQSISEKSVASGKANPSLNKPLLELEEIELKYFLKNFGKHTREVHVPAAARNPKRRMPRWSDFRVPPDEAEKAAAEGRRVTVLSHVDQGLRVMREEEGEGVPEPRGVPLSNLKKEKSAGKKKEKKEEKEKNKIDMEAVSSAVRAHEEPLQTDKSLVRRSVLGSKGDTLDKSERQAKKEAKEDELHASQKSLGIHDDQIEYRPSLEERSNSASLDEWTLLEPDQQDEEVRVDSYKDEEVDGVVSL